MSPSLVRPERDKRPQLNSLLAIAHEVCRRRGGYERLVEANFLAVGRAVTAADVRRAVDRLPYDERAVLVLWEVVGRTCLEIAEILSFPTPAVETLLFRARRALREELAGSLTCSKAELAASRGLDDRLSRHERRLLRAHLSSCEACDAFARTLRAQQAALRALAQTASFAPLGRLIR